MPGEDRTGFQSWRYRPEDKVVNTSFDHAVDRTMIAGSAMSHLHLYATEPILVTLPNWERKNPVTLQRSFQRVAQAHG